jgi:DNA-binding CsgD family transcriptional regulator
LSKEATTRPIVVALDVGEPELEAQLRALLGDVPGLTIATEGTPADVRLVKPSRHGAEMEVELTPREHDVLELLVEGASNKEIARRLGISASTVKFHVRSVADKLGADGRTDAVAHALRRGLVHL